METVATAWAAAVAEAGDRTMLVFEDREISYLELDRESDRVAAGLLARGRVRGERIALIGLNRPEWIVIYLAAAKLGLVVVALSVRYREGEILHMVGQSEAVLLIAPRRVGDFDYVDYLSTLRPRLPSLQDIVFTDGDASPLYAKDAKDGSEVGAAALAHAESQVRPTDPLVLIYTSGTTGTPKGAVLTHRSQLASAQAEQSHMRVTSRDLMTLAMPLNHVGGITCAFLTLVLARGACVLFPAFQARDFTHQIKEHHATIVVGVPTMLTLLLREPECLEIERERVRLVVTGGSNVEPALFEALCAMFPKATVMNLYGLSETSGAAVMSPWNADPEIVLHSIGKPLGGVALAVHDDAGSAVPVGETGELWIKGDVVVDGYYAMPEETKQSITDGWLHTGDVAYLDEAGNVFLRGRKKEMFLQGGYNVYPVEVENVLARHPAVLMVAGIGIPDPVMGEIGCYFVVPKPGFTVEDAELIGFCKDKVADYKVPRRIVQRTELPMTPAGKIMKVALKNG